VEFLGYDIGAWSYGSPRVLSWGEGTKLKVGRFCSIADGVTVLLGRNHRTDWITRYPFTAFWPEAKELQGHIMTRGDVVIENDVWIGLDAVILSRCPDRKWCSHRCEKRRYARRGRLLGWSI
jgi:virginiamycin A acetyltransferase